MVKMLTGASHNGYRTANRCNPILRSVWTLPTHHRVEQEIISIMNDAHLRDVLFQFASGNVERLTDRRQVNTSFFVTINTAIVAVIGLLIKDANLVDSWLQPTVFFLLCAGIATCWLWQRSLHLYEELIGWWYTRLRDLEADLPVAARLVTLEYQKYYQDPSEARRMSMTRRESQLCTLLITLYSVFAAGTIIYLAASLLGFFA